MEVGGLIQIVHFHQTNTGGLIYATHDRGVITWRQVCDDRGFPSISGYVAAGLDVVDLVGGDDPTNDCCRPVVIRGNQRSRAVVQLQCRISQWIGNAKLAELWTYGSNNYPPWFGPLNYEAANHYFVACLNKGARTDVA